jgi:hypothetical protein
VTDNRSQADRILIARISDIARRHARWHEPTADQEAAAVAALRELAGGRADLLAQIAGTEEGFFEGGLEEPPARQIGQLCRAAGADLDAIRRGS